MVGQAVEAVIFDCDTQGEDAHASRRRIDDLRTKPAYERMDEAQPGGE